jgi:CrcB protein
VTALWVVLGAAVGAPLRYLTDRALQFTHDTAFPWGTFTVNIAGSFVLGLVMGGPAPAAVAAVLGTGFCGALTTWSTLGYETVRLAEDGAPSGAVFNMVFSVLAGLGAAGLGLTLGGGLW